MCRLAITISRHQHNWECVAYLKNQTKEIFRDNYKSRWFSEGGFENLGISNNSIYMRPLSHHSPTITGCDCFKRSYDKVLKMSCKYSLYLFNKNGLLSFIVYFYKWRQAKSCIILIPHVYNSIVSHWRHYQLYTSIVSRCRYYQLYSSIVWRWRHYQLYSSIVRRWRHYQLYSSIVRRWRHYQLYSSIVRRWRHYQAYSSI